MFCTLRSGRMLFWEDQHDVGHTPPVSVWDVSGMATTWTLSDAGKRNKIAERNCAKSQPRPFARHFCIVHWQHEKV